MIKNSLLALVPAHLITSSTAVFAQSGGGGDWRNILVD